ncbi:semaphorin-4E [Cheilinus undulatus]|uniref:semaphorin-4E n=1 Tax=Cheilinus undulatus TaxID=241271 RepID=UPI001BD50909|nr:semaphorin-4E [Cheilinus undulatus]XP_041659141.1 semaphorin-4E [Cheilinus undulatus]
MHPLLSLCVFWLLPLTLTLEEDSPLDCVPRRSVPYHRDNAHLFWEEGVFNYSTMLLREDLNLLMLGAREAVFALDLKDISKKHASVKWKVTQKQEEECKNKGKDPETECKNYIRVLQKMEDNRMYVCGTNAFDPECDYMSYADGNLTLEKAAEDGKGLCPFDPFQRYASIMFENSLYSATSMNFLGSEPALMRSNPNPIRTEFKSSWLNEPTFVSLTEMPESQQSESGDDDKVYMFFSETAVECDCYNKLVVSRVARVCKGDLGGQRTLQKKWTSFLKARMDCPVLESQLPYIIQDTYLWCDKQKHWRDCLFFAVFTPQSDTSDLSAVCAYRVSDISKVFTEGKYKTPVHVETSFVKWVMYSGDVPFPRPGACIDNAARKEGINQTLGLPDRTLQFIKDRPLMDQAIQPIDEKPKLVRRGATFTRIIVNQAQAADGNKYHVMFVGTEEGTLLKAVNYDEEMFIIEEIQLFEPQEPIKILKFSDAMGQIYAGSDYGAAQVPLATCHRSSSCMDCVLARDPYCGWDIVERKCIFLSTSQRELIQSVKDGNASDCPDADPVKPIIQSILPGGNLKLHCTSPSNLAKTAWERDGSPLTPATRLQFLRDGLLILNASDSDAGRYRCLSIEHSKADKYSTTVAEYQVSIGTTGTGNRTVIVPQPQVESPSVAGLQVVVALLLVSLLALLAWNFYKGHIPLPWNCRKRNSAQSLETHEQDGLSRNALRLEVAEEKPLVLGTDNGRSNNNHTGGEAAFNAADEHEDTVTLPTLKYIDDESEI